MADGPSNKQKLPSFTIICNVSSVITLSVLKTQIEDRRRLCEREKCVILHDDTFNDACYTI